MPPVETISMQESRSQKENKQGLWLGSTVARRLYIFPVISERKFPEKIQEKNLEPLFHGNFNRP